MKTSAQDYNLTAVGVGPGDPELITIKGKRTIEAAHLIFVPRSKNGEQSLALRIAKPWLDTKRQHIIELSLPMTRAAEQLIPAWQAAADQIADGFKHYENRPSGPTKAVYLLLGDPLLYGTFTYIWAELTQRHPEINIQIVPGITSYAAAAAQAQFILSTTSDRVAILPASYETDASQLRQLLANFDCLILMKVGPVLPQILAALAEMNILQFALYAERVGMPEERIIQGLEINKLQNQSQPYLSLLIIRQKRHLY